MCDQRGYSEEGQGRGLCTIDCSKVSVGRQLERPCHSRSHAVLLRLIMELLRLSLEFGESALGIDVYGILCDFALQDSGVRGFEALRNTRPRGARLTRLNRCLTDCGVYWNVSERGYSGSGRAEELTRMTAFWIPLRLIVSRPDGSGDLASQKQRRRPSLSGRRSCKVAHTMVGQALARSLAGE